MNVTHSDDIKLVNKKSLLYYATQKAVIHFKFISLELPIQPQNVNTTLPLVTVLYKGFGEYEGNGISDCISLTPFHSLCFSINMDVTETSHIPLRSHFSVLETGILAKLI
jgi:hypothetical protein